MTTLLIFLSPPPGIACCDSSGEFPKPCASAHDRLDQHRITSRAVLLLRESGQHQRPRGGRRVVRVALGEGGMASREG